MLGPVDDKQGVPGGPDHPFSNTLDPKDSIATQRTDMEAHLPATSTRSTTSKVKNAVNPLSSFKFPCSHRPLPDYHPRRNQRPNQTRKQPYRSMLSKPNAHRTRRFLAANVLPRLALCSVVQAPSPLVLPGAQAEDPLLRRQAYPFALCCSNTVELL